MPARKTVRHITVEQYLAREERASIKHEYVDGKVFAMSGVTRHHNLIATNIYSALRAHLKGSKCRAYVAEVKARIEATNSFYYPDVMVSCDSFDNKSVFTDKPCLIVEVTSRSTARIDRSEKLNAYKQIESLQEYLIVDQPKKQVELHRRNSNGAWEYVTFDDPTNDIILESLPSGPMRLSMDAIYEDVDVPSAAEWRVREEAGEYSEFDECDEDDESEADDDW